MMPQNTYPYEPNYSVPPGWLIEEIIENRGWSQAELARRCGHPRKVISEIIGGKAPITSSTAIELERVLGIPAQIWSSMESAYRLREARNAEKTESKNSFDWAKKFPTRELVKRGFIKESKNLSETMNELLSFFGFGNIKAWNSRYQNLSVQYRKSPSFENRFEDIVSWLRIGEIRANQEINALYDRTQFMNALREIRLFTNDDPMEFYPKMKHLCAQAGVFYACEPPFGKNRLSGAAFWISPHCAIIQMTLRYKTNDHFWFTFFHEAGHILLHSKQDTFVDMDDGNADEKEKEANQFASDLLIPSRQWSAFTDRSRYQRESILQFANKLHVAPAIVVGRLQHEGKIPYKNFNDLKVKFEWDNGD